MTEHQKAIAAHFAKQSKDLGLLLADVRHAQAAMTDLNRVAMTGLGKVAECNALCKTINSITTELNDLEQSITRLLNVPLPHWMMEHMQ
ncbi:MAG: hypothetical protein ACLQIQ_07510 [Beijerinckiaceae bacterium]